MTRNEAATNPRLPLARAERRRVNFDERIEGTGKAMEHIKIPWKSWVVICDGAKALVFCNEGDAELLNLTLLDVLAQREPPSKELGTDRPGRVHQSHGAARSAVEVTDLHLEAEIAFITKLAEQLDKAVREHAVSNVILVAPPKALGMLRKHVSPALRAVVTAEIAKDLAHLSSREIEEHLAG
jgi:protein required for attachment to host cells